MSTNVTLEALDVNNWLKICDLSVSEEQKHIFTVPNVYWIGISRYEHKNELFAIKLGDEFVGMIGGGFDEDGESGLIEPVMVDYRFQGRGIAEQALKLMVKYLANHLSVNRVYIEHRRENHAMTHILNKIDFEMLGEDEEGFRHFFDVRKI